MNHLPIQSEFQDLLPYLNEQEIEEIDLLLSAPQKEEPTPANFAHWLIEASPTFTWHWRHHVRIRYYLASMDRGELDRLAIVVPPRHGKSELVTVRRPAFMLEHDPARRFIIGAYNNNLATRFSRKARGIVRQRGIVRLNPERQASDDWETQAEGGVRAAGVSTGVTGHGANEIIIDDPTKSRAEANSRAYRDAVWDWYTDDLYTRLEPHGRVICIATRWHEDDLIGRLLQSEDAEHWTLCRLAAIAEGNKDELDRAPGEALCPERFDGKQLGRIKAVLGQSWHALYQGRPVPMEGNIILSQWFRYYDAPHRRYPKRVQSWDCANKDKDLNSWSVCTTWGVAEASHDLLDQWRERAQFPALLAAAKQQAEKHNPTAILIEDKGNGTALLQTLRSTTRLPVIAIEPHGDKVMRLSNESPAYESGLVRHPRAVDAPWVVDFEAELVTIPNAPHDDRGDTVSQFLSWIKKHKGRTRIGSAGRRMFN